MLAALAKAFRQLADPRCRAVAIKTLAVSTALFLALAAAAGWALGAVAAFGIGWLDRGVQALGALGALVLAAMLFPAIAAAAMGLFLEEIADAVEARHYPDAPAPRGISPAASLAASLRLAAAAAALNLLALPIYLLPGANVFVFLGLNGYLLGREYFELAALRRMGADEARALRKRHGRRVFAAGVVIAGLSSVPVVNWLTPMVAAAFMVHEVQAIGRRGIRTGPDGGTGRRGF